MIYKTSHFDAVLQSISFEDLYSAVGEALGDDNGQQNARDEAVGTVLGMTFATEPSKEREQLEISCPTRHTGRTAHSAKLDSRKA